MTQPLQPNLVGLPLAPAQCVCDLALEDVISNTIVEIIKKNKISDENLLSNYVDSYRKWIEATKLNKISGLGTFPVAAYSNGTSESFDKFYLKNNSKRFRCFEGEYLYHKLTWEKHFAWANIEEFPLDKNDAVIVSLPFADTGNIHPLFDKDFLDTCYNLGIPVLVDCAFFGICGDIEFNFDHPAITDICFSLSKSFPVNNFRIGIRFTREDDFDSLLVYHNSQYINKLGAAIGLELFKIQHIDAVFNRYREQQLTWCKDLGLEASSTVIFGVDKNQRYPKYNRGMKNNNRICFSKYFNSTLPTNI